MQDEYGRLDGFDVPRAFVAETTDWMASLEIDLARLMFVYPDVADTVSSIIAGTKATDARLNTLMIAVCECPTVRLLESRLIANSIGPADARAIVAAVTDRDLADAPDQAVRIAEAVVLQRFEAEIIARGEARDLVGLIAALQAFTEAKERFSDGGNLLPLLNRAAPVPHLIPPRRWLYGTAYLRGVVAALVAAGGTGKSILLIVEALAMATGRRLLHIAPTKRSRVFLLNTEDPLEEIDRRIAAVAKHFGIQPQDYQGRFYWESGHTIPLKIASSDPKVGFKLNRATLARLKRTIVTMEIDVLVVDPIISAHAVNENDTNAIDAVVKALSALAVETNAAVQLSHHVRKGPPGQARDLDIEDVRGAVAFVDAARIVRLAQRMNASEAPALHVEERHRWRYFRVFNGKLNHAPPPEDSEWYCLDSVDLGNGDAENPAGDTVGVPIPYVPPSLGEGLPADILDRVAIAAEGARYRADPRAAHWFGIAAAPLCGLDPTQKSDRARLIELIKAWVRNGVLAEVVRYVPRRREDKIFIGRAGVDPHLVDSPAEASSPKA